MEIAKRRRSGTVLSLELITVHSLDSLNTASYSSASAVPELIPCTVCGGVVVGKLAKEIREERNGI